MELRARASRSPCQGGGSLTPRDRLIHRVWRTAGLSPDPEWWRTAPFDQKHPFLVKLQKVAYIADRYLGLPIGFQIDLFLYGPYWSYLADLYYDPLFPYRVRRARPLPGRTGCILSNLGRLSASELQALSYFIWFVFDRGEDPMEAVRAVAGIHPIPPHDVYSLYARLKDVEGWCE